MHGEPSVTDHGGIDVTVTATTAELAEKVLRQATDGAADEPEPQPENVTTGCWYVSPRRGPHRTTRQISAGTWEEVRPNYTAPVADAMGRLRTWSVCTRPWSAPAAVPPGSRWAR